MKKTGLLLILIMSALFGSSVMAQESLDGDFELILDSDAGDYVGQGEYRDFRDGTDFLGFRKAYSREDDAGVIFSVEGFDIDLNLSFEPMGGEFAPGMYYPAKRFPFNDKFSGIDVSGGGRGCNKIVGGFYIHEFEKDSERNVQKAAIDFVQYCEGHLVGMYGSLRYNSTVPSSCDAFGCDEVRGMFVEPENDSEIQVDHVSLDQIEQKVIDVAHKLETLYPTFYDHCARADFEGGDAQLVDESEKTYVNINACDGKYKNELAGANLVLEKILGVRTPSSDTGAPLRENEKAQLQTMIQALITKIDSVAVSLKESGKFSTKADIILGAIIYVFEAASIGVELL